MFLNLTDHNPKNSPESPKRAIPPNGAKLEDMVVIPKPMLLVYISRSQKVFELDPIIQKKPRRAQKNTMAQWEINEKQLDRALQKKS